MHFTPTSFAIHLPNFLPCKTQHSNLEKDCQVAEAPKITETEWGANFNSKPGNFISG